MSQQPSLFKRLKRSRIVQALLVYLAASYAVLQLVETLKELLALPDWIGPVTVILVGIGLLVITATAWVQSLDSTTKAEEAGEVPTDWEIDAADALASLKAGRLPHLTWGRAILGGVVALSLTIGAAGAYVLVTGGQGLLGPAEAGAGVVAEGIAVLPFDARGDELAIYREGMVDLLSASFDGIGGYRTINSRTVFARWEEEVGQATAPDLDAALRAAGRTGARYAILGSMVPAGTQVRINVDIYDLSDGSNIGSARVDGSPDDIFALVDGLSVAIARELLGAAGEQAATERRLASITTSSVDALKDFLEGERLYRLGDFVGAAEALERAVTTDSTFALAWVRLGSTSGWASKPGARWGGPPSSTPDSHRSRSTWSISRSPRATVRRLVWRSMPIELPAVRTTPTRRIGTRASTSSSVMKPRCKRGLPPRSSSRTRGVRWGSSVGSLVATWYRVSSS